MTQSLLMSLGSPYPDHSCIWADKAYLLFAPHSRGKICKDELWREHSHENTGNENRVRRKALAENKILLWRSGNGSTKLAGRHQCVSERACSV